MMFYSVVMCIQFTRYNNKSIQTYLYCTVYFVLVYKLTLSKEDFKNVKSEKQKNID